MARPSVWCPERAKSIFYWNLKTIPDFGFAGTRQTTREDEILRVVRKTGIDEERFLQAFRDGSAETLFHDDLTYTRSLGIYSLPAYLVQYGDRAVLINWLADFDSFVHVIGELSKG